MVMTHGTYAKGQGRRSLGSKVIVKTDGQTDEGDYIKLVTPVLTRSVEIILKTFVIVR